MYPGLKDFGLMRLIASVGVGTIEAVVFVLDEKGDEIQLLCESSVFLNDSISSLYECRFPVVPQIVCTL